MNPFDTVDISAVEKVLAGDQGGYMFVAKVASHLDLNEVLHTFRKCYAISEYELIPDKSDFVELNGEKFKVAKLEDYYTSMYEEMESFGVNVDRLADEFNDGVRIWGSHIPDNLKEAFNLENYISHIGYQDVLHEGIFEAVVKFDEFYLYWYHG